MPAKSEKQAKLMQAAKHNPEVAKRTGITPSVAKKVLGEAHEGSPSHRSGPRYNAAGAEPSGKYRKY